jgi:mannose-6-phosphate isomerase-like protein (cupin superfamily)
LNTLAATKPASERALNNYSLNRIPFPRGCHWNNHWHKHDDEDELFLVEEGKLFVDLEGKTIELLPHQAFVVPKGTMHRTRAPKRTVVLMMASAGVVPTGD